MQNKKIKILILEHDITDVELTLYELKRKEVNFEHLVATNKESFEASLKTFSPDIILSDYMLPAFDGISAFQLKENICPGIPFIIVSGMVGEENAVEFIKAGITDYVMKDKLYPLTEKITKALISSREKKEKAETEKNLQESEKRLAEAQALGHIGNWEIDFIKKKEYWSDEVYRILGLEPQEKEPSLAVFLSFIHPESAEQIRENIEQARSELQSFSYSTKIIRQDGEVRYVFSTGKYVIDKGQPVRLIGVLQDVTETKNLEKELKELNKELETFIYRASHDLRGPLSSIIGLTNMSKAEIKDPAAVKYFEMVEASAVKLDNTLVSLVQSMTMRDMKVHLEEVDFNEIISEITSQLKYHEGFQRIKINITNNVLGVIKSNKLVLSSVFQNLIQNAVKYQNYNSNDSFLNITISKKKNALEIIFEDNGIGIDDALQNKIFDMYFRGTTSISGSGLGLYIVKIGVEKLSGKISFKSKKGVGTTFTIQLPFAKDQVILE